MRLAVFTNQFPGPVCTFFARDMRGLIDAGVDIDIFAIYPLDQRLWRYVPEILNEKILPKSKVHHLTLGESLRATVTNWPSRKVFQFLSDIASISSHGIKVGIEPFAKNCYVFLKAWVWAHHYGNQFDHVLGYWGNYTGTGAYLFRRIVDPLMPFSLFVHAGIDLYENQVYLREKLLDANNIITCSDFNRLLIERRFSDIWESVSGNVHVHHHGVDFATFSFEHDKRSSRKILAVGSLESYKGFDYLVQALGLLVERGVECKLEFVGDGRERDSLTKMVKELRLSEHVIFRGWLGPELIPSVMKKASVLVHPSPELGDGVPNVIKEAMAVGTPVIGSTVAGIPEILAGGKNGLLVPPKNVHALADAIETLLKNETLRQDYARQARRHAEKNFDLWRNGRELANLLCARKRLKPEQITL